MTSAPGDFAGPHPPPDPSARELLARREVLVAVAIAVVVALGFGLVVPVLPLFAREFGVGLFAVTAVVSIFAGVRLVSNVATGGIADRFGTRQSIGWGAMIVGLSNLLTATAGSYWVLLVYRGIGGFGSALFFNALLTYVIQLVPPHQRGRAVGLLQGAFLFGFVVGPSVGGLLAEPLGLRGPFVVYAVACVAAGAIGFFLLPKPAEIAAARPDVSLPDDDGDVPATPAPGAPRNPRELFSAARELCTHPAFIAALIMMIASRWAAIGVRFTLVPVFGEEVVGLTSFMIGASVTVAALGHLAVVYPAGRIADLRGRRALALPAYAGFAVVAVLLGFATTPVAFFLFMVAYGVGTGFTSVSPPAIVGDVAPPARTGTAVAVLNTAGDLGMVVGPLVSGALAQAVGYEIGFASAGVMLAIGAVAAWRMNETLVRPGVNPT